jgi:hypothetical protein
MVVENRVFAGLLRDNGNEKGINKCGFVAFHKNTSCRPSVQG